MAKGDAEREQKLADAACYLTHCSAGKADSDPVKQDLIAQEARGKGYAAEITLLQNTGLFTYTDVDRLLDKFNSFDAKGVSGLNKTELEAKNREIAACRKVETCEQGVKTRYDRLTSDRTETVLTSINVMKVYDQCSPADAACIAGSLAQMQALLMDMKQRGMTADNTDRIGLTATISAAQTALGNTTEFFNAAGSAVIGPNASNAGNSTPGKLSGRRTEIPQNADAATARSLKRESDSADALVRAGYNVEQNPKVEGPKNPDYSVNNKIYDNFAPETSNVRNIWSTVENKVQSGQAKNVVLNLSDSQVDVKVLKVQFEKYPIKNLDYVLVVDKYGNVTKLF